MTIKTHRVKIIVDYEGEPIEQIVLDRMMVHLGDDFAVTLRNRHAFADGLFTLGAHQTIDTHLED